MANYNSSYTGVQIDDAVARVITAKNSGGIVSGNTLSTTLQSYLLSSTAASTYLPKASLLNLVYPIGSVYISVSNIDPSTVLGGTWEQLQDTFLLAAGATYTNGDTGGSDKHTHTYSHTHTTPATTTGSHILTVAEMPTHGGHLIQGNWAGYGSYWLPNSALNNGAYGWNVESGNEARPVRNNAGGGGGHTHDQVATTTDSQSASTTSEVSNMPPYLVVYMWKRVA